MLATLAAADSAKVQKKKYSVFIYSEVEPHAMYAIYKQTSKLCVLQYTDMSSFLCFRHAARVRSGYPAEASEESE